MKNLILPMCLSLGLLTGCSDSKSTLAEEYIECVANKDVECITSKVSKFDAKFLNNKVDICMSKMSNQKQKENILFEYTLKFNKELYSRASKNEFNRYSTNINWSWHSGQPIPDLTTSKNIIEKYEPFLTEEAKGYFKIRIAETEQKKLFSNDEFLAKWFDEYYTDESFCVAQYIENIEYEKLNIVEVKETSSDAYTVRYEFIKDDDSSEKNSLKVESIDKVWSISNRPYFKVSSLHRYL